ncbi:MAG: Gfo/Idh/MocA family oxidoreductase [Phenylobacterium sp.]|uniref:Gfo/Idh/MocA family protein n=1 Tax=Phenylobacterium sp. TaxID=1871053 RepID=UPI0027335A37|nr:Gfo/Idh/MocA family oxidoreductase [Phenylobacterium sp.]MDP3174715.1 Gfo/Idh/MocA family oxidoreductase [Phenylobacterium sp.]
MRFGLIGAGGIGAVRAQALTRSANCTLVAVHDVDPARARQAAPQAAFHADVASLLASPDVDAVVIATPPQFHERLAIDAMDAGKHVLVEKPMAASVEACRAMTETAKRTGRTLAVGFNHRYFEALKLLRDTVASGELGTLSHVRAYAGHMGLAEFKAPWMYDPQVMGGGALFDNGIHVLDLVRYVMGDVTEVFGHALHKVWNLPAEDNALALLRNADGVVGSLQASWSEWKGYQFHIEAYGAHGMARAYYAPMQATVITMDKPGGARRVQRLFYPKAMLREKLQGWQSTVIAAFIEEFDDFIAATRGEPGSGRAASGVDGLRSVEVAKAVYESGASGRAVMLEPLN